ncbi:MAG TPA: nucleotide sugar dehydrogenase, partial [Alphaproteobacteria bacterium]|nr:nucleotide sugar dehydrogenase [Alphaproteobacteria bacterium]
PSQWVAGMRRDKKFEATTEMARLAEPDAILICVPTPLTSDRQPEMKYVEKSTADIAANLRKGQLVVLESTTYPGTTANLMQPVLEKAGLKCGTDFFLAFSPEREDPGNPNFSTGSIPKVVGADDATSQALAVQLYSQIVPQVVSVSSAATAEAVKLTENIFRAVNIAFVNELKIIYDKMGIDVWEVIDAAKTKPFGFMPFYPGPGLGGHCIPIDPFYLTWAARNYGLDTKFIELAGEVNTAMPDYVINKMTAALGKPLAQSKILILGMAYKKNVDDVRESPSLDIMAKLLDAGAQVDFHDPHVPLLKTKKAGGKLNNTPSQPLNPKTIANYDACLILTDHDKVDYEFLAQHATLIIDTRNAIKTPMKNVIKA